MNYVECGKQEGATVITGGERHGKKGYFIQPVSGVTLSLRLVSAAPRLRSHILSKKCPSPLRTPSTCHTAAFIATSLC
jgi:hypothetical protein